jgi:hypothetical protein
MLGFCTLTFWERQAPILTGKSSHTLVREMQQQQLLFNAWLERRRKMGGFHGGNNFWWIILIIVPIFLVLDE